MSMMNFFQIVKFGLEIVEIFAQCCCNTKLLQEIAFFHLARVFRAVVPKISGEFPPFIQCKCFEQLCHDTAPKSNLNPDFVVEPRLIFTLLIRPPHYYSQFIFVPAKSPYVFL